MYQKHLENNHRRRMKVHWSLPLTIVVLCVWNSSGWWQPKPFDGLTWQWQISSIPDTTNLLQVAMYDVDLFETPTEVIAAIKRRGIIVTCYFSAGTYEGWRPDWREYFSFISDDNYTGNEPPFLGKMDDWDERWLDVRRIDLLEPIMQARMRLAKQKGCDCVEPDNMDSYTNLHEVNPTGAYTYEHQLAYNRAIAQWAHEESLSVALKNDIEQLEDLVNYFDWALNEECFQYEECDAYQIFINAGKAVFGVEYQGDTSTICPEAFSRGMSWLKKNLELDAWVQACPVKRSTSNSIIGNRQLHKDVLKRSLQMFDIYGRRVGKGNRASSIYIIANGNGCIKEKRLFWSEQP